MKKAILFIVGAGIGVIADKAANTDRGKRIINWATTKVQEQINNLISKVDKVTETTTPIEETQTGDL